MNTKVFAPWSRDQIDKLIWWQDCPYHHAYTCSAHSNDPLIPTKDGWKCRFCDYKQDWFLDFDLPLMKEHVQRLELMFKDFKDQK